MARPKLETTMVRKNFYLPEVHVSALEYISEQHGVTETDVVRGAVNHWLKAYRVASQSARNEMIDAAKALAK